MAKHPKEIPYNVIEYVYVQHRWSETTVRNKLNNNVMSRKVSKKDALRRIEDARHRRSLDLACKFDSDVVPGGINNHYYGQPRQGRKYTSIIEQGCIIKKRSRKYAKITPELAAIKGI